MSKLRCDPAPPQSPAGRLHHRSGGPGDPQGQHRDPQRRRGPPEAADHQERGPAGARGLSDPRRERRQRPPL